MRLRDLREDNDITQNQIALMLNIKQNTYSQYENGKREVPINILWKLADFYDVSIDYLVGREKERKDKQTNIVYDVRLFYLYKL